MHCRPAAFFPPVPCSEVDWILVVRCMRLSALYLQHRGLAVLEAALIRPSRPPGAR